MGLDVYLRNGPEADYETDHEEWKRQFDETQSTKSVKYPEHICGPRYLRSSYNSGGFNSRIGDLIGEDLYSIFSPPDGEYDWHPTKEQLTEARERAMAVIEKIKAVELPLGAFDVSTSHGVKATSDAEAIVITLEQLRRDRVLGGGWSCQEGHFYPDGIKIVGMIPGESFMGPCVYMVHQVDLEYYIQMAEIVVEFIDAALEMDDPRISWSG